MVKLAWTAAAIDAHRSGELDLMTRRPVRSVGQTAYRDVLASLPGDTVLPWVSLLGLALVTSANPAFNDLTQQTTLQRRVGQMPAVVAASGFSDTDLDGPVRENRISARAAAELLVHIARGAHGDLVPLLAGMTNGARTTRLARDAEDLPGLPAGFTGANKTGSLSGVRNDVALFSDGPSALVIAALTSEQPDGPRVDGELADLAVELVRARWL